MTQEFKPATDRQRSYLDSLARRAGYEDAAAACKFILTAAGMKWTGLDALSLQDARYVITELEHDAPASEGALPSAQDAAGIASLSACDLRAIAMGAMDRPHGLDSDARWVLERLQFAQHVLAHVPSDHPLRPPPSRGVNGDEPMLMEHLLAYFKTWDRLADAFRVTVPTAKAWGTLVPDARMYEAEVKTGGYVRVPRELRG